MRDSPSPFIVRAEGLPGWVARAAEDFFVPEFVAEHAGFGCCLLATAVGKDAAPHMGKATASWGTVSGSDC